MYICLEDGMRASLLCVSKDGESTVDLAISSYVQVIRLCIPTFKPS
jgi:hypothetical protein